MKFAVVALALSTLTFGGQIWAQETENTVLRQEFEFEVRNSRLGDRAVFESDRFAEGPYVWGLKASKDGQVRAFFLETFTGEYAPPDMYWLDDVPVPGLYHRAFPEGRHEIYALTPAGEVVVCAVRKGFWGRNFTHQAWVYTPQCEVRLQGMGSQDVAFNGRGWNLKKKSKTRRDSMMKLTVKVKP